MLKGLCCQIKNIFGQFENGANTSMTVLMRLSSFTKIWFGTLELAGFLMKCYVSESTHYSKFCF